MNLFDLSGEDVKIHVDMLAIPQFEKVWKAYEDKDQSIRFLRYVILNNYPLSPYVTSYMTKDRRALLTKELLYEMTVDPELLDETEKAFLSLHDSLKEKLLRRLRATMEDFVDDLDSGKIGLEKAIELGPKMEKLIQSINKLEADIKMELSGNSKIKGGYKIGILEKRRGF